MLLCSFTSSADECNNGSDEIDNGRICDISACVDTGNEGVDDCKDALFRGICSLRRSSGERTRRDEAELALVLVLLEPLLLL